MTPNMDALLSELAHQLVRLTEDCNLYVSNQIPEHAESVRTQVKHIITYFQGIKIPHILEIVQQLETTLASECAHDGATHPLREADFVSAIRRVSDIVEAKNLVLQYKPKVS